LEGSFTINPQIPNVLSPSLELVLHSSKILWECLLDCWKPEYFLPALSHRFFKLSLQLLGRYKSWIESALSEGKDTTKELWLQPLLSFTPNQWIYVSYDIQQVSEKIINTYLKYVNESNSTLPSEVLLMMKESYLESINMLMSLLPSIGTRITGNITRKCIESLQPLYGITATYRMTNKEIPTRPSYYVSNITIPLQQFCNEADTFLLTKNKVAWIHQVLTVVTEKYLEMTTSLLNTINKQQESLKKMAKKSTKSNSEIISDVDKIHLQLYLDVEEFSSQTKKFGIDTENFEPYQKLSKCVLTGQKIKESLSNLK